MGRKNWRSHSDRGRRPKLPRGSKEKEISAMSEILWRIGERDNWVCWICGLKVTPGDTRNNTRPTKDHLIPQSLGGSHGMWNLRISHHACNNGRNDKVPPPIYELVRYVDYRSYGHLYERFKKAYGYEFSTYQRAAAGQASGFSEEQSEASAVSSR